LTILILTLAVSNSFGQGVMDLLERLEKVEKQLNWCKAEIAKQQNQPELTPSDPIDLTVYDESLLEMAVRLTELEKELRFATQEQSSMYADLSTQLGQVPQQEESSHDAEWSVNEISFTGFIDGSYYYDGPSASNSFGFDQAEVNIEKNIGEVGSLRADVEWVSDGAGGFALDAEQGYVTFSPKALGPVSFTFGKFNAPIGFELLDAPDMYQYSHALVFNYGLPTNVTGAMVSADFGSGLDWSVYIVNGWDQNVDLNTGKTIGSRFGYTNDNWGCVGFSFTYGADSEAEGDHQTVVDFDMSFNPWSWWTIGSEFNFGSTAVGTASNKWTGFLLMNHWDFNDWFGLTARFDYFDDKNGSRLGSSVAEKRKAFTFAPTFGLGDGMGALVEFRYDFSDQYVFTDSDGAPKKSGFTAAYEMTYSF
ncbi:outer membrane beta-barrel protein, partial [Neptuniibacter sp.]|uniref:outer membrane beta-barrel protein n=1 Tax=Neptuniibacter sp. TaxID=1962643 RepID=UPI002624C329